MSLLFELACLAWLRLCRPAASCLNLSSLVGGLPCLYVPAPTHRSGNHQCLCLPWLPLSNIVSFFFYQANSQSLTYQASCCFPSLTFPTVPWRRRPRPWSAVTSAGPPRSRAHHDGPVASPWFLPYPRVGVPATALALSCAHAHRWRASTIGLSGRSVTPPSPATTRERARSLAPRCPVPSPRRGAPPRHSRLCSELRPVRAPRRDP